MILLTLLVECFYLFILVKVLILGEWSQPFLLWSSLVNLGFLLLCRRRVAQDWQFMRTRTKEWLWVQWKDWGEPFLVAAVLALLIRTFLLGPYKIPTGSMYPTFLVGDRIFVDKVSYRFREPERGDIIVFKYPLDKKKDFVKRLAGLPGDELEVRDGKLIVNGEEMTEEPFSQHYYYNRPDWQYAKEGQIIRVPKGYYFALGDNSAQSSDSRNWGFVARGQVIGKAFCIWWPPRRIKLVD